MTRSAMRLVRLVSSGTRSSGWSTWPWTVAANSPTSWRTWLVNGLVPTARLSDFWNLAVAIICMVLVILRMLRTAFRRLTIARALGMSYATLQCRGGAERFGRNYAQAGGFRKTARCVAHAGGLAAFCS